jgi:hypothetical protein
MSQFKDIITIELLNSLGTLHSLRDRDDMSRYPDVEWAEYTAEKIVKAFEGKYVPFVSEVEEFNALMNKPNNYEPTIPAESEWDFVYKFVLEELEEYKHACEKETSLKFWMRCVTLLMYPLGTVLCFMVLRIKFGPLIWKYRRRIFQKLVLHKKRHKILLKYVPKNKANLVTMNRLVTSMLYIVAETEK